MMQYWVLFTDGTGCEFEARDKDHAEAMALELYPDKQIVSDATVCCEFLDMPF